MSVVLKKMTTFHDVTFIGFDSFTIQELYRMLRHKVTKLKQPWKGLAACISGKYLYVINVFTGDILREGEGSTFVVIDDRRVAYTMDSITTIYSIETWQPLFSLPKIESTTAEYNTIYALRMLRNGNLASGGYDSCITIWNITTTEKVQVLALPSGSIFDICELYDGLLAGSTYSAVYIWNPNTGVNIQTLAVQGHAYSLTELSGKYLCVGAYNVTVWNAQTGQLVKTLLHDNTDDDDFNAYDCSVSAAEDNTILCGTSKGDIYHWTVNGDVIKSAKLTSIQCVQYVGDQRALISDENRLILWDMAKNEPIKEIHKSEHNIYHIKMIR
jgi:WD40 repeat protein